MAYGFSALGAADGAVKNAMLGNNNARLHNFKPARRTALTNDGIAQAKLIYAREGGMRTNLSYGYVLKTRA